MANQAQAPRALAPLPALPRSGGRKATPRSCECGCGGTTRGGRFVPGHDSRQRGWAIRIASGADTTGITKGERESAEGFLARHPEIARVDKPAAKAPKAPRAPRLAKAPKATAPTAEQGDGSQPTA